MKAYRGLLLAWLLSLIAGSAYASNWVLLGPIGQEDGKEIIGEAYFDQTNSYRVDSSGNKVIFGLHNYYEEHKMDGVGTLKSSIYEVLINCSNNTYALGGVIRYSEQMGRGKEEVIIPFGKRPINMSPIKQGSGYVEMRDFACSGKKQIVTNERQILEDAKLGFAANPAFHWEKQLKRGNLSFALSKFVGNVPRGEKYGWTSVSIEKPSRTRSWNSYEVDKAIVFLNQIDCAKGVQRSVVSINYGEFPNSAASINVDTEAGEWSRIEKGSVLEELQQLVCPS